MKRHLFLPFGSIVLKLLKYTGILEKFTGILITKGFKNHGWDGEAFQSLAVFQSLLATDIEVARAENSKISTPPAFYSIFRYIESIFNMVN